MHPGIPEPLRHIEWQTYGLTVLNPVAFSIVLLMCVVLFFISRRYAILPIIAIALFITSMQRFVIATLDFPMLRFMIIIGFLRVAVRAEHRLIHLNSIDKMIIAFALLGVASGTILWGTFGAFISRCGNAVDLLGIYFLCRIFIHDIEDFERVIKAIVIMSVPVALFMVNEQVSGRNYFSTLGGVPEMTFIREGKVRSQGAFSHPIIAGGFGATLMPLVIGHWFRTREKRILVIGIISTATITITSNSSAPFLTYLAAIIGLSFWPLRRHMRIVLWSGVACLVGLHMVMKAPVWALVARSGIISGSGGYHRFALIDSAIKNLHEWWLVGTYSTGHWGWGLQDVTNMYVRIGVNGGLIYLLLFLIIIASCFKTVGRTILTIEDQPDLQKFIWAMGACLFSYTVLFMGVSLFGQIVFFWYMILAMISSLQGIDFSEQSAT